MGDQLTFRKPTEDDIRVFHESLAVDEHHSDKDADWWLSAPGTFVVYELNGKRLFIRTENVMRVHMQHEIGSTPKEVAPLIDQVCRFLMDIGKKSGFSEMVFDSVAPALIRFMRRNFSFEALKDNYRKLL